MEHEPRAVVLEIVDAGNGAGGRGDRQGSGHGLPGMRERAALHGGQLTAGPSAGGGFAVRVKLPTPDGGL